MNLKLLSGTFFVTAFFLAACASSSPYLPVEKIPASNSEEIHVDKAFDFVYLNVFDAANEMKTWSPTKTLKDEGLIQLRNSQFSRFDESDRREIYLRVRRDTPMKTSVFLEPDSRRVIGADEVLAAVRKKLGVTA